MASEPRPAPSGQLTKNGRTRSQIGRANAAKGKAQERKVVAYLRVSGWPGAERTVRTGYRVNGRTSRDRGDIDGTPGIVWQIKDTAEREWWRIPAWMNDTQEQKEAAKADIGILVVRRAGHAHPSEWWAQTYLHDLVGLVGAPHDLAPPNVLVRLELGELLPILRNAGYGSDPGQEAIA
jgi:hypothetical protein